MTLHYASIGSFVDHYNYCRYHERLSILARANVYTERGQAILERRETIKRRTIEHRRLLASASDRQYCQRRCAEASVNSRLKTSRLF